VVSRRLMPFSIFEAISPSGNGNGRFFDFPEEGDVCYPLLSKI
jgi:hypothetical protein